MTDETERVDQQQRMAAVAVIRAAMDFVNKSPVGAELTGTGFANALAAGEATITLEITLNHGPIRILATWANAGIEQMECLCMPFGWQQPIAQ